MSLFAGGLWSSSTILGTRQGFAAAELAITTLITSYALLVASYAVFTATTETSTVSDSTELAAAVLAESVASSGCIY
eukprot:146300-Ditylum_brightwellii.AAC.1